MSPVRRRIKTEAIVTYEEYWVVTRFHSHYIYYRVGCRGKGFSGRAGAGPTGTGRPSW